MAQNNSSALARQNTGSSLATQKSELFTSGGKTRNSSGSDLSAYKMPTGIVSSAQFIPPQINAIIKSQFEAVGINFELADLTATAGKDLASQTKELRTVTEQLKNNAKLLPEIAKCLKECLNVGVKNAAMQASVAKHALKTQFKIDGLLAEVLTAGAGYAVARKALERRLEMRLKLLQAVDEARASSEETTWARKKAFMEASFNESSKRAEQRYASKQKIQQANSQKAMESTKYVESALT